MITNFGKATLSDRYLLPDETPDQLFERVAKAYQQDDAHGDRLRFYMQNQWFMPSTPILANGGTQRGLPISCFINEVGDSLASISDTQTENLWLAARGGGIGTYWGNLRSIGESVGGVGKTSGIVPFIKIQDSQTLGISQGSLRRGSAAVYVKINHPEIIEFINMRKPTGGDPDRKCLNMHHGVVIDDSFMKAVESDGAYNLLSPATEEVIKTVRARNLWHSLLELRAETGEPYILWIDTVNRSLKRHQLSQELFVKTSNLCIEITLPTSETRTAVCCLSSLNIEKYDEWEKYGNSVVYDVLLFLDNVLQSFIDKGPDTHSKARYSAQMERSVGLGVMGFHGYLMDKGWPFGSEDSRKFNAKFFGWLGNETAKVSQRLAKEKEPCPDWLNADTGYQEPLRFSNTTAIAPTASISIICGGATPGIDPVPANIYTHKTASGSFTVKNKYLERTLQKCGKNDPEIWGEILRKGGSVRGLDFLTIQEREIFKTAFEIDQMEVVNFAADRQPYIDQSQSLNIFINADSDKGYLNNLHLEAWRRGVKSMYYCRNKAIRKVENIGEKVDREIIEECEVCQ